jgi:hypothetical protein
LVLDGLRRQVLRYSRSGEFQFAAGGEGSGPGEFRAPSRLLWLGDTVGVWDPLLVRLTLFGADGRPLRDTAFRSLGRFREIERGPAQQLLIQLGPRWRSPPDSLNGVGQLRLVSTTDTNVPASTLVQWVDTTSAIPFVAPGISMVAQRPFGARASWTTDQHSVYFARGPSYDISLYSWSGAEQGRLSRAYEPHEPSPEEQDSARGYIAALDPQLSAQARLARFKPAIERMIVDDTGWLGVLTSTKDDRTLRQWDLFDLQRRYATKVLLPAALRVEAVRENVVYGVVTDSLGVQAVMNHRITLPAPCARARRSAQETDRGA